MLRHPEKLYMELADRTTSNPAWHAWIKTIHVDLLFYPFVILMFDKRYNL
jgi:hypothetical protein